MSRPDPCPLTQPRRRFGRPSATRLRLGALAAAALVVAACGGGPTAVPTQAPTATPTAAPSSTPAPTGTPPPTATPAPSDGLVALYREIEDQVLEIRGLPAKQRLEPTILSEAEAAERLRVQFEEKNPPDKIAIAQGTLQALNLLPEDADLGQLYDDIRGSQIAGFYDPETAELVVVSRSGTIGANEKVTFAHEFTHALQDQAFDVTGIRAGANEQGDRWLGRLSLLEGDATLLMTLWLSKHLTRDELRELLVIDPDAQAVLEAMPAILRETLLFPYQQGLVFANGIWARGGWSAVNAAYRRLPDSTEQVLHPEKYEAGERPVDVALDAGDVAAGMGAGWSGTPEDTLGEFQLSIWLRENGIEAPDAAAAAAGWGGDRLAYLRGPAGAWALVLRTAWDTAADAAEFVDAAGTAVGGGRSPGTVVRAAPKQVVVVLASDGDALNRAVDAAGLDLPD